MRSRLSTTEPRLQTHHHCASFFK